MSTMPSNNSSPSFSVPHDKLPIQSRAVRFHKMLEGVEKRITPLWALQDSVATNPLDGFTDEPFIEVAEQIKQYSKCDLLPSLSYFRDQFQSGNLATLELNQAIDEMVADEIPGAESLISGKLLERLKTDKPSDDSEDARRITSLVEAIDRRLKSNWASLVTEQIGRLCADHYDQGQASWQNRWQHLPLYQAWKERFRYDRSMDVAGISDFRFFVKTLPTDAASAIAYFLEKLEVPEILHESFLLSHAFATLGWSSWTANQSHGDRNEPIQGSDLIELLAIRLAYDLAISEHEKFSLNWNSLARQLPPVQLATQPNQTQLELLALTRAMELSYRTDLVSMLRSKENSSPETPSDLPESQFVFCIDVRSERIRRHLETLSTGIECLSMPGFFGVPFELMTTLDSQPVNQYHPLLEPVCTVSQALDSDSKQNGSQFWHAPLKHANQALQGMRSSLIGAFTYVETLGWVHGVDMAIRTLARKAFWSSQSTAQANPQLAFSETLQQRGLSLGDQTELATGIIQTLGIENRFAKDIVFCGHESSSENNPLQSGLDCGACGGHSGRMNAIFAAQLLNDPSVRETLSERGIKIPAETTFRAAVHNTTVDQLTLLKQTSDESKPSQALLALQKQMDQAGSATRKERLPSLVCESLSEIKMQGTDWSNVRPEWGLAGNAAFLAAPSSQLRGLPLDGRTFLHQYDADQDHELHQLHQILNGPLLVAQWINLHYYFSVVDPTYFGSGNKTIHNIVGQFGILNGNGGDLQFGLPLQSIHDGKELMHEPLRLLVVIAAKRSAIEQVISQSEKVSTMLQNGWLNLGCIEDGQYYRFSQQGSWADWQPAQKKNDSTAPEQLLSRPHARKQKRVDSNVN